MTTERAHGAALPLPLVSRTVAVDPATLPADLLDLLPATGGIAWVRRGDGLVAWGELTRITTTGPGRLRDAEATWRDVVGRAVVRDEVRAPGTGPVAFGSFSFAADSPAGGVLVVPRVVVGRRGPIAWVTTLDAGAVAPAPELLAQPPATSPGLVRYLDGALDRHQWRAAVAEAVAEIRAGRLDKVVLAREVLAATSAPLDVRWALHRLAEDYRACWTFAVDGMLGATPELLVRSEKGLVTSRVLAGTIRRTGDDDADLAHAALLAHSSKDLEEHEYAVASLTDALAPFCSSTNVPETPFVLHLPNVLHLATDIAGVLAADPHGQHPSSLTLADALHPTAAVAGTPTREACALIERLEGMDRGRYAGPVGWVGADGDGEWALALRSAEVDRADPHRMRLFAGCGIVAASDPTAELAESEAKLEPMRHALDA
jgi:menaquinone-specific isochorismate synthase